MNDVQAQVFMITFFSSWNITNKWSPTLLAMCFGATECIATANRARFLCTLCSSELAGAMRDRDSSDLEQNSGLL